MYFFVHTQINILKNTCVHSCTQVPETTPCCIPRTSVCKALNQLPGVNVYWTCHVCAAHLHQPNTTANLCIHLTGTLYQHRTPHRTAAPFYLCSSPFHKQRCNVFQFCNGMVLCMQFHQGPGRGKWHGLL